MGGNEEKCAYKINLYVSAIKTVIVFHVDYLCQAKEKENAGLKMSVTQKR
jgi:hypothetical protein